MPVTPTDADAATLTAARLVAQALDYASETAAAEHACRLGISSQRFLLHRMASGSLLAGTRLSSRSPSLYGSPTRTPVASPSHSGTSATASAFTTPEKNIVTPSTTSPYSVIQSNNDAAVATSTLNPVPIPIGLITAPGQCSNDRLGCLHPGAVFRGHQTSGRTAYTVRVEIQHVDLHNATMCGYLLIDGLTDSYPQLTTFFDAQIIDGQRNHFLTRQWDADAGYDILHWKRFKAFEPYVDSFNDDTKPQITRLPFLSLPEPVLRPQESSMRHFDDDEEEDFAMDEETSTSNDELIRGRLRRVTRRRDSVRAARPFHGPETRNVTPERAEPELTELPVFMRWKEHFLVPNHRIDSVAGASFAGFYYICVKPYQGTIEGYYFHRNSELFQRLTLGYVPQITTDSFEFR